MRIEYCSYILKTAELGSITRAAEYLFISQQGLSRAIKAVEQELGVSLFSRSGNQLVPTLAGQTVLSHMRAMAAEYENLKTNLTELSGQQPHSPLTLLVPYNVVNSILPTIVNRLTSDIPHLALSIREEIPPEIPRPENFDAHTLAILCIPDFLLAQCPGIRSGAVVFEEYARGPLMALVSSSSPLSALPLLPAERLKTLPLAGQQLEMAMVRHILGDEACPLNTFMASSRFSLYRSLIAKGMAVGLSSTVLERFTRPQPLVLVPLDAKVNIVWGCAYLREFPPTGAAAAALELTKSLLEPNHAY